MLLQSFVFSKQKVSVYHVFEINDPSNGFSAVPSGATGRRSEGVSQKASLIARVKGFQLDAVHIAAVVGISHIQNLIFVIMSGSSRRICRIRF